MPRVVVLLLVMSLGCSHAGIQREGESSAGETTANTGDKRQLPQRINAKHLPNPVQVHPKVISGGLPEGDKAFHELQALGVKNFGRWAYRRSSVSTA